MIYSIIDYTIYNGHIIIWTLWAFLFEKYPDAKTQSEHSEKLWLEASIQKLNNWKRLGLLGKLHNIINYII